MKYLGYALICSMPASWLDAYDDNAAKGGRCHWLYQHLAPDATATACGAE